MKNNLLMLGMEMMREDLRFMEEYAQNEIRMDEVKSTFNHLKSSWKLAEKEVIDAKMRLS